jgi:hypothetical protein
VACGHVQLSLLRPGRMASIHREGPLLRNPPKSEWLIDAFQLMGCAGLALVVIRGALSLFF